MWVAVEPADIYRYGGPLPNFTYFGTVPAGKTIAAMSEMDGNVFVVLEDGQWGYIETSRDYLEWHSTGSPNIFDGGGPVSIEPTTWGNLKQKFVK